MTLLAKIASIRSRLNKLRDIDQQFSLYGARKHKYQLNAPLEEAVISTFEERFRIRLPEDYKSFLMLVGNGGAGPFNGMEKLEDSIYADLDFKRDNDLINPAIPFPIAEPWNVTFPGDDEDSEEYKSFLREYSDPKWEAGLLRICNFGCGIFINLVVNGKEYGHIWTDHRANDEGIYPAPYVNQTEASQTNRLSFLEWYSLWLNRSLNELERR